MYRDTVSVKDTLASDSTNMGNLPWKEVFRDPKLQALIEQGLSHNVNLQTAMLRVDEAKASLLAAKLAFAPSFALAPQGTVARFSGVTAETYSLPVTASWQVDAFGGLLNAKRGAKSSLLQSEAYRQAVQTQVIANIANCYYTLLMLDKQLDITEKTAKMWGENVEAMKAMKKAGMTNEAGVSQSEATYYQVNATLPDLRRQIRETENTLSLLLAQSPQQIQRGTLADQQMPEKLSVGIPLQMLSNRPDVKQAEMTLASAYYSTNQARSAFYPQITLSGSAGWTNSAGSVIVNPGKFLLSAVGSLTQPLFARGANAARLKIAKAEQQAALLAFQQSILSAGSEVSNALYQYQVAGEKCIQRKQQIESLNSSVDKTQQLMKYGSSTYLEVLTAQQSLLSASLSDVADSFQRIQAVINLYQALGGGR
jgi:NodT family efflux transporter outer membrane factor (OMF) lipoprotein